MAADKSFTPAALTARLVALRAVQGALLIPLLAGLFLLALAGAQSLPNAPIEKHLAVDTVDFSKDRPYAFNGRKVDMTTECIGVSYGIGAPEKGAVDRAARSPVFLGCPTLLAHLSGAPAATSDYARYWHGYAVLSRLLLSALPYHDVRMLIFNAVVLLFFTLGLSLYRKFGLTFAFAVLFPFFFINYAGFMTLITKAVTWFVALGGAIYFARAERPYRRDPFIAFFIIGALTSYLELLTTPLFVFGFCAFIYFFEFYRRGGGAGPRGDFLRLFLAGGFWAAGYALLWITKFMIAAAVIGPDLWRDVVETAAFRLNGAYESTKPWFGAATLENFEVFHVGWGAVVIVVFLIMPFARPQRRRAALDFARRGPVYVALGLSPYAWFELMSNHSQIHGIFTHANLVLFFLPLSLILFDQTGRALPQKHA